MSELPDYIVSHLNEIAKNEGFLDFTIETKPGSNQGDNFIGELISAILIGKREMAGKKVDHRLDLLCKIAPMNVHRRKRFHSELLFAREAFVYNKLLPTFVEFQKERGLLDHESFISFPKCYFATSDPEKEEFFLIMDDLRAEGYKMWPKNKPLPIDHCRLVVQELAKFHAVSYALKDQKPEIFDEFKNLSDLIRVFFQNDAMSTENLQKMFDGVLDVIEGDEHKAVLEHIKMNYYAYLEDVFNEDNHEAIGVVCHGDCWNNNFIYKYPNDNEKAGPNEICLVDWQITRFTSPAIDFLHCIFLSTDKNLRNEEYENLKHLYHSTLSNHIEKLGSSAEELFSYAEFESQLKRFGNFVLLTAPWMIPVLLVKPEDLVDLNEASEQLARGEEVNGFFKGFDNNSQRLLNERMTGIVADIMSFGYYRKL